MGYLRRVAWAASATAALACAPGFGLGSAAYAGTTVINFGQIGLSNTVTGIASGGSTTIDITDAAALVTSFLGGGAPFGAFVDLTAKSTDAALPIGSAVFQDYAGTFCITSAVKCGGTNYLSGAFTDLVAGVGLQLSLNVSDPPDVLTLTSSVIPGNELGAPSALGFTFTNVSPAAHITGGTIASFTASFTGNASASAIPEPSTWAMMAIGFAGLGFAGYRSSRKAMSIAD